MTALATLYLFPEMIFNAELVSTAGSANASHETIQRLELFGRAISGVGVTLLLLDGWRWLPLYSKGKTLLVSLVIAVLVWPLVFFGQKYAIDEFLIEPSSAEQRQTAFLSILVKNALATRAVEVEGLPFDYEQPNSAVSQTFLSLFGGLVYANADVLEQIKQSREELATAYVVNQTQDQFPELLAQHARLSELLNDAYNDSYAPAYDDYQQAILDSPQVVAREWQEVQEQLQQGWRDYQKMEREADTLAARQAEEAGPKIIDFLDYYHGNCVSGERVNQRCRDRAETRYKQQIGQLGYGYIPHEHWLIVEEVSTGENILNSLLAGALTGGVSIAAQALNKVTGGDGGFEDKRYSYTDSIAHYKQRITELDAYQKKFVREYGYPLGLDSEQLFIQYPETQQRVRDKLAGAGVKLAADWQLNDRASFERAIVEKIASEAMREWSNGLSKQAIDLPPGLSWYEFHQHPEMLAYVNRHAQGLELRRYNPDWNDGQFKQYVLEPMVREQAQKLLAELAAQTSSFADGGELEERGKQSLRAVIIPPFSMALSLLLVCLTLLKLPMRYLQLLMAKPSAAWRWFNRFVVVASLGAVVAVPMWVLQPDFHKEYPGANSFLRTLGQTTNLSVAKSLEWTLKTQPLIAPMGSKLAELSNFDDNVQPTLDQLEALDAWMEDLLNER